MSLQGSQMEADDPTTSYMLQVCRHQWERICLASLILRMD